MLRREVIALLVLTIASLLLNTPGIAEDCFADTDAAVHAMDGIFFTDLLLDHPSPGHWKEYAIEYFARYPSLGLVIYPPLYPLSLVPFHLILGDSAAVARGAMLLYAIANLLAFYFLVRRNANPDAAFLATAFLVTNVEVIRWSRDAMLEIPACLFMNLAALAWTEFIDRGRRWCGPAAALALALAIHAKQPAGFLLAPLVCHGLLRLGPVPFLRNRTVRTSGAIFALLMAPLTILTIQHGHYGTVQLTPATYGYSMVSPGYWLHWAVSLPEAIHPGVLVLALAAAVSALRPPSRSRSFVLFLALWFLSWYLTFSYLPIKTIRFATFVVPAVAALAGIAAAELGGRVLRATAAVLIAFLFIQGAREPVAFIDGYDDAATLCAAENDGRPILFDGYHSANFIFHMRRATDHGDAVVLRGSKMITSTASGALASYPLLKTETELVAMLNRYAVSRIVVEDRVEPALSLAHTKWLRAFLERGPFTLEATIPIRTNIEAFRNRSLLVYRYTEAPPSPADGYLEMYVPSAGMTIRVFTGRRQAGSSFTR